MKYEIFSFKPDIDSEKIKIIKQKISLFINKNNEQHLNNHLFLIGGDGTFITKLNQVKNDNLFIHLIKSGRDTYLGEEINEYFKNDPFKKINEFNEYQIIEGENKYAINEILIMGDLLLECEICINDQHFQTFRGLGLCISTSLGSTALNQSLSSPVLFPKDNLYVLSYLMPKQTKKLNSINNPLILNENEKIKIVFISKNKKIYFDNKEENIGNELNISFKKSNSKIFVEKNINNLLNKLIKHFTNQKD